jgi:hypothetical protein
MPDNNDQSSISTPALIMEAEVSVAMSAVECL